jgi:hypothetical protein
MVHLLDVYRKNVGQRSLFCDTIIIDFYDGPTEAICQLIDSEQWYICSLVYIAIEKTQRIFTTIEISKDLFLKFKSIFENRTADPGEFYQMLKERVAAVYNGYSGNVFLFKCDWLNSVEYEVVEIPLRELLYFNNIEEVLEQDEESKLKWKNFFLSST